MKMHCGQLGEGMTNTQADQIDESLSIRKGRLFVEECDAARLARRFGTPLYVVSEDQLRRNIRRFRRAFVGRWSEGPVNVLASAKANFTLALLRIVAQEGAGCDTFGFGELQGALNAGIPPELISVNGSTKSRELIEAALRSGARITLDSRAEADLVCEVARSLGVRARVRFRLRPSYEGLDQPSDFYTEPTPIRLAAQHYKPGIPTEDLFALGPEALDAPELDVTGVMVHLGRHSNDLGVWRGMVRSLVSLVAELSHAWGGWEPREIDLGGGFATPRDPTGRADRRGSERLDAAPSVEAYAEVLVDTLRAELERFGLHPKGKTLEVEPGRSLFADAGIQLATVRGLKRQTQPALWDWIETDTSEMFLLDTILERNRWALVVAEKADRPATGTADVVGISCGFDVIVHEAGVPEVTVGDVLAFLDTGAYQDACANNFNALPRPAVLLVHGAEAEIVKRAETIEDVFRRDIVPARLRTTGSTEVVR
jgi:diaminopimelate decarboxylase